MKNNNYHISVDPYKEDGSGSMTIYKETERIKNTPIISITKFEDFKSHKPNMDFIKDSKYKVDTKWLEENNE